MLIEDLILAASIGIYRFLPAYLANASALAFGGGRTIDDHRLFIDGKPLLGSHKTVRGFVIAVIAGFLVGLVQGEAVVGFLMGLGAALGDLVGSFMKRRLSMAPGMPFPALDQFDFLLGAYGVSFPHLRLSSLSALLVFICTPAVHIISNYVSCAIGIKQVPW